MLAKIACFGVVGTWMALCSWAAAELTVTINLKDQGGEPIPGVEVSAVIVPHMDDGGGIGLTDTNGRAVFTLSSPPDARECWAGISFGDDPSASTKERARRANRNVELAKLYSWKSDYIQVVTPEQTEMTFDIVLGPAIVVTGVAHDAGGVAIGLLTVRARNVPVGAQIDNVTGEFALGGITPGTETDLFFSGHNSCIVWQHLTAAQTQTSFQLPELTMNCGEQNASAVITLDQTNWPGPESDQLVPGVFLVNADGSAILEYGAEDDGDIVEGLPGSSTTLPIPAGTWYLVPGLFDAELDLPLRAFDLVRSGQTNLVPNWPTITVAPGETATATVHAAELDAAIRATMPPE